MPQTRKDLSVVKIWTQKRWEEIRCGKPKIERKQTINLRTACNDHLPYESNPGAVEYSIELPDVDHNYLGFFKGIMKRQEKTNLRTSTVSLAVFSYNNKGKLVRDWYLGEVYFESMTEEGNEPFDMKGGALVNYDN